ncbi:hypothetical protein MBLNU230_g6684t1 [Neophaeotheca triangularis]
MPAPANETSRSIQAYFPPTPQTSPQKQPLGSSPQHSARPSQPGDGFTEEEIRDALKPKPAQPWTPTTDYAESNISHLTPGPRAVTFMGRVANIFDVGNTPKTPRSAKGCVKLCVKDDTAAITVRVWYAHRLPNLRLGSLLSIWTTHVSNGENGTLSSASAPLFTSLFPERDRSCHLMVHENSDDGSMCRRPMGFRSGQALGGLMTLQNFNEGGFDVVGAKILVVVKSVGVKKRVTRKDKSVVENISIHVHDDTAEATLGLWGSSANTPQGGSVLDDTPNSPSGPDPVPTRHSWKAGETVLLLQAPGSKIGTRTYLSLTSTTILDINPSIPDTLWLRKWSLRQKSRESINPIFPPATFDLAALTTSPRRTLYTLADLDGFARATHAETFQGYLSVIVAETRLHALYKSRCLFSSECCSIPVFANAVSALCKGCGKDVVLRLNPLILGQIMDETACVAPGKLLLSKRAWRDLLGREPGRLLELGCEEVKYLADRLLFARLTLVFGWTGDETVAGGRICVLRVMT